MNRICILDFTRGIVAVIPSPATRTEHTLTDAVDAWCERNDVSSSDCQWMEFEREIVIEP